MTRLLNYPKCLLSAAIIMVGLVMGVARQDDLFADFLFWMGGNFFSVAFTVVIGLVAVVVFVWKRRIGKFLSYSLVIGCSTFVSVNVFMETGGWINRWKIDAVESYVARAVPILDQIKQKEGAYPTNLPTDVLGEPPELLRDDGCYSATPSSFRFEYVDEPAGWAGDGGALEFDSASREWRYDDGDDSPSQSKTRAIDGHR
jgi:hypothetical protein